MYKREIPYIVLQKGFNTTVQKIVNNNGISNPNLIYPGQRLIIAKSTATIQTKYMSYRIKRGDTLWGIAINIILL